MTVLLPVLFGLLTQSALAAPTPIHEGVGSRSGHSIRLPHLIEILDDSHASRPSTNSTCIPSHPSHNVTERLQEVLQAFGDVLTLCPSEHYHIVNMLNFTAARQEIRTEDYPTDDTRATLIVSGPTGDYPAWNHTTAINGQCNACDGVKVRNIQVNGMRAGPNTLGGGANLEMGGPTNGQLIEFVHSFNPRGWSAMHVMEGGNKCHNATVVHNDVGPAGYDSELNWADGISLSCANSYVAHNQLNNPTDGGIVVFGSPGSIIEHNTIWVENRTLLGGINMVDFNPWGGDFTDIIVRNNTIIGGQGGRNATGFEAIIKIGIAIGPRTWFGDEFGTDRNENGTVLENSFTGMLGYAIGASSANNFTIEGNVALPGASFVGDVTDDTCRGVPTPQAFVYDDMTMSNCYLQNEFFDGDTDLLTCVVPPGPVFALAVMARSMSSWLVDLSQFLQRHVERFISSRKLTDTSKYQV